MASFDPSTRQSRRAVIAGALGAALASVAATLGRPARATATDGDGMFVGVSTMEATHITALTTTGGDGFRATTSDTTSGVAALHGIASATDAGVYGVIGETPSVGGVGVGASASATSGQTYGLAASVHSDEGKAVQAMAVGNSGSTSYAVYAVNYAADGTTVHAQGVGTGAPRALVAQVNTTGGTGILAYTGPSALPANIGSTAILGVADQGSASIGVYGQTPYGTGVVGYSTGGLAAAKPPANVGVYGRAATDSASKGVYGSSTTGVGVYGSATTGKAIAANASGVAGIALNATAADATGYALKTSGRLSFGKVSGVATLLANATTAVVTPGTDLTSSSFVLLTPRGDPGLRRLWYTVDATANTLTIHASASAATNLSVAWLLVG